MNIMKDKGVVIQHCREVLKLTVDSVAVSVGISKIELSDMEMGCRIISPRLINFYAIQLDVNCNVMHALLSNRSDFPGLQSIFVRILRWYFEFSAKLERS